MNDRKIKPAFFVILICILSHIFFGCATQLDTSQKPIKQEITEIAVHGQCKKYTKNGITVVYLTGTPYEIGFGHGKLCKEEILQAHEYHFSLYDNRKNSEYMQGWMKTAKEVKKHIPEEYIEEMRGIGDGSSIGYDKILFANLLSTLSTIGQKKGCFAFAFKNPDSQILTFRQGDMGRKTDLYKKMILYIVKPNQGFGYAAIELPGWVDGSSGMNEKGITVSQNNIGIKQNIWKMTPITHLSRSMLQYSETLDDIEQLLDKQQGYPARLIFASSSGTAAVFEFANSEKARIDMKDDFLALSNHARKIPSRQLGGSSGKRLSFANDYLTKHMNNMTIENALNLVRSSIISRTSFWDRFRVHNRLSIVFSPGTLDFWIAIPPKYSNKPASAGPYIGFNLLDELYKTGDKPNPLFFPATD